MTHPAVKSIRGEYIRGGYSANLFSHLVTCLFCPLRTGVSLTLVSETVRPSSGGTYALVHTLVGHRVTSGSLSAPQRQARLAGDSPTAVVLVRVRVPGRLPLIPKTLYSLPSSWPRWPCLLKVEAKAGAEGTWAGRLARKLTAPQM